MPTAAIVRDAQTRGVGCRHAGGFARVPKRLRTTSGACKVGGPPATVPTASTGVRCLNHEKQMRETQPASSSLWSKFRTPEGERGEPVRVTVPAAARASLIFRRL